MRFKTITFKTANKTIGNEYFKKSLLPQPMLKSQKGGSVVMFALLIIVASVTFMYRAAEMEDRSGILWGALTLALCLFFGNLVVWVPFGWLLGLLASYLTMFALNLSTKR